MELKRYRIGLGLLLSVFAAGALRFVFLGNLNHDEGYYLCASRLVWQGKIPYADFALFQAPLLPYVYGIPQAVLGGGIVIGRLTSFVLGAATFLLACSLARRLGGEIAALVAGALLAATNTFLWAFSTTRMEPLGAFFIVVSAWFLLARPGRIPQALAVSAMVWASAVRISNLPAALLVLGVVLYESRASRRWCAGLAALAAGQFALLLGAPLAVSGRRMIFDVLEAQLFRDRQFRPSEAMGFMDRVITTSSSILDHLTRLYPGVTIVVLALGLCALISWRTRIFRRLPPASRTLTILAIVLYLPQITVAYVGEVYLLASIVLLAILAGCGIQRLHDALAPGRGASLALGLAGSAVLVQLATMPLDTVYVSTSFSPTRRISQVAERVAQLIPKDRQVVTFSAYLAVEANRAVAPGFETSWFSFFPALPRGRAAELHVLNTELLKEAVVNPATAGVLFTDFDFRLLASAQGLALPARRPLAEEDLFAVLDGLQSNYALVDVVPAFGQWHDNLYILTRRSPGV
jgi:hypothetical protein